MKKNFIYALWGAIALIGATGLVSCSDETVLAEDNPGYDPVTGEVPVNFVFNVETGNKSNNATRMSAANTQAATSDNFRGIDHALLLSFKLDTDGKYVTAPSTGLDGAYDMGKILDAGALNAAPSSSATHSRRVIELALPVGTNAMMFWGKAIKNGTDQQQGKIDWSVNSADISQNKFSLVRIVPDDTGEGATILDNGQTALAQYEALIAGVLTKIVQTETTISDKTLKWSDYVTMTKNSSGVVEISSKTMDPTDNTITICPLGKILADAFVTMNTIYENELRAGSGSDIARMIGDLYSEIHAVSIATVTSDAETAAKRLAGVIESNLARAFTNLATSCAWTVNESLMSGIKTFAGFAPETDKVPANADLNNFPQNFNLPTGAVILEFGLDDNSKPRYYYMGTIPTYAMGGGATGGTANSNFDPKNYMYPAELCYFGNSPLRVTNKSLEASQYPDGVTNWDADASWTANEWTALSHVQSSTRSVAMQYNINYGTALLKSVVKYGVNTLKDNNAEIQLARNGVTEEDATFDVSSNSPFTLTSILVGGQPQTVGWNYLSTGTDFSNMIYDSDITSAAIPAGGGTSAPNYTLVWDNWAESNKGSSQRKVYVALEFQNNSGKDFWGEKNLIRNGGKFYITGELDPDKGRSTTDFSEGITWPSTTSPYALPPYDTDGSTIKQRRVFMQDYVTDATFVLGENSLKHALVTVPDLRATHISLGLSVDLEWREGLKYNDVVLGEVSGSDTGGSTGSGSSSGTGGD